MSMCSVNKLTDLFDSSYKRWPLRQAWCRLRYVTERHETADVRFWRRKTGRRYCTTACRWHHSGRRSTSSLWWRSVTTSSSTCSLPSWWKASRWMAMPLKYDMVIFILVYVYPRLGYIRNKHVLREYYEFDCSPSKFCCLKRNVRTCKLVVVV